MPLTNPETLKLRYIRAELLDTGETQCVLRTPKGELFRIDASAEEVRRVLGRCDGARSVREIISESPNPEAYTQMISVLLKEGVLASGASIDGEEHWVRFDRLEHRPHPLRASTAILVGDERLGSLFLQLPLAGGLQVVRLTPGDDLEDMLSLPADPAIRLVLILQSRLEPSAMRVVDGLCEKYGVPWTSFHLENGTGILGPHVVPGRTANYCDVLMRRLTAGEYDDISRAELTASSITGPSYYPPEAELLWMLSLWAIDLERWLAGAPCRLLSVEGEVDPVTLQVQWHPILPGPERTLTDEFQISAPRDASLLVDNRAGIITGIRVIEHAPAIPTRLVTVQTDVANMARAYTWSNNLVCGGSAFDDFPSARMAAIGEAIERYCGNRVMEEGLITASFADLQAAGAYAIDPEDLVLYSDKQYQTEGFPFVPFTRDSVVAWVHGVSLTKGVEAWIPASLVYVNWHVKEYKDDKPRNYLYYPGLAAGSSVEMALCSAIEEIIERDATMIWWMNAQPLPAVQLTPKLEAIWAGEPRRLGQRAWAIYVENEFDFPVIAGVVENTEERLLNVGFAARPDPVTAVLKAWTEALTLQDGSRDLDNPNGLLRQAIALGEFRDDALKPWRANRKYMDEYRKDYRDVHDLMCQQQFFLDPRAIEYVRPYLGNPPERELSELPRLPGRSLRDYRKLVESRGYEIFYVDVTTPDVALTNLRVVRVVIPGLVANFPAAFPFLGRRRIQDTAVRLGWRKEALAEEELNYFPLPHA